MLEKIFTDPGARIKKYAKALFVIESIAAIIGGLVYMDGDFDEFFFCLLIAAGGIIAAYIMSLFMAAFGDLVQSCIDNKKINEEILEKIKEKPQA